MAEVERSLVTMFFAILSQCFIVKMHYSQKDNSKEQKRQWFKRIKPALELYQMVNEMDIFHKQGVRLFITHWLNDNILVYLPEMT